MADSGLILPAYPFVESQIQPASLDLRLGDIAYRVRASFLPGPGSTVAERIDELKLHEGRGVRCNRHGKRRFAVGRAGLEIIGPRRQVEAQPAVLGERSLRQWTNRNGGRIGNVACNDIQGALAGRWWLKERRSPP